LLEQIVPLAQRIESLSRLADVYQSLDQPESGVGHLLSARTLLDQVDDEREKVSAILFVARGYFKLENTEPLNQLIDQVIQLSRNASQPRQRTEMLLEVAGCINEMQYADRALKLVQEAAEAAGRVNDDLSRAYSLVDVAAGFVVVGRNNQAEISLQQAEEIADKMVGDASMKQALMEKLASQRKRL